MLKQAVAQFQIQRVGIGQDQVFGLRRREADRFVWLRCGQGADGVGDVARKAVGRDIDPSDHHTGQGGYGPDQRAPDMTRAPDPQMPFRAGKWFDHPALQQVRLGQHALAARAVQQAFDGKRQGRAIGAARHKRQVGVGQVGWV